MSDLPYHQALKKTLPETLPSSFARRQSQPGSFYSSPTDLQMRSYSYHSYQPQLQEKKIFGFEIFINNEILRQLEPIDNWFNSLANQHHVESIRFNPDLGIPDLNGRNIQIFDHEMDKKYHCAKSLLHDVYQIFKTIKKEMFSIIIFVPEGMVSLLIGTKGHQINKIMRQSYTKIVVNQPINKMTYRTAKIQGQYSDIAKACKMIYEILEQKSAIAYAIEKEPSQFDYTKAKIKTKFLFTYQTIKHLMKKKKPFLDKVEEQTGCTISFETDKRNHLIKEDEEILVINGKLEDVQAYIVMLINILHPLLSEDKKNVDYTLKLLIPANYVTKLIGQKGYMIKDIIERSGGAQIKILSDREAERDTKECIISINGTIQNKIDATCFILEQIECFKNGGPILQSGKSINENLVQQFKNSIPLHNEAQKASLKIDLEHTNTPTQNSVVTPLPTVDPRPQPVAALSPPIKHFSSVPPHKSQQDNDKSQEQGLIQAQSQEEKPKQSVQVQVPKIPKALTPSERQSSVSHRQRQRERSRDVVKERRGQQSRKKRSKSKSSSVEFKYDREYVQIKLLIPERLAKDYRELQYIEGICRSKITVPDYQKIGDLGNEAVIVIKGYMKDNTKTIKILQKRISRYQNN